jgi:hypothetical protein
MITNNNIYILVIYLYIVYITYLDSLNLSSKIPVVFYKVFGKSIVKLLLLTSIIYITANCDIQIGLLLAFAYVLTINLLDKRMIEETFFTELNQYTENFENEDHEDHEDHENNT